ncbi:MAG: hypothetical protein ACKOPQ_01510 [Novosphingobium sp.]
MHSGLGWTKGLGTMIHRAARCLTLLSALSLAACSSGDSDETPESPKRLVIPSQPAPMREAPKQPEGAVWSAAADGSAAFGAPGLGPLLTIACERRGTLDARLVFHRYTRADEGAKALFAIEGNGHVARIPLDAVKAGEPGEWRGAVSAFDEAVEAIKGGYGVAATLPGGGTLRWPGTPVPGRVLDDCRGGLKVPKDTPSEPAASDEPEG